MKICPSCQHQNENEAQFCTQCGYPLPSNGVSSETSAVSSSPVETQAPQPSTSNPYVPSEPPVPTEMPATYASQVPQQPAQEENRGILIAAIAGASVLTIAAIGAATFFATRPSEPDIADTPVATETDSPNPVETSPSPSPKPSPSPSAEASTLDTSKDLTQAESDVWKIVSPSGLNCRSGPGTDNAVVKTFPRNQEVVLNTRYDSPIKTDAKGKPWLAVGQPGVDCFVRANTALIAAVPGKTPPMGGTVSRDNCPGDTHQTYFAETKGFYLNLCEAKEEPGRFYYVGTAKNGSGDITLPIETADANGYTAKNKDTLYRLDLENQRLLVTQGEKTIFNQKFVNSGAVQ